MTALTDRLQLALWPAFQRALRRFPVPILFAVTATAILLWLVDRVQPDAPRAERAMWIILACVAGFFGSMLAVLMAHRWSEPRLIRQALAAAVGLVLSAAVYFWRDQLDLIAILLIAGLVVALTVAGAAGRRSDDEAFWIFNHDLWLTSLVALLSVLLLAGGTSAILGTANVLLGLPLDANVFGRLWTVALGTIGPVIWLALVPEPRDAPAGTIPTGGFINRAIAFIAKFILAPLLFAYAVILHLYAGKIVLAGALPDGKLGWMVLIYGACLVATALLAYPVRETGGALMRLYWRLWPWLLAVPLVLLLLAIMKRIDVYGWTEQRYMVVLLGIWLALVVLSQGLAWRGRSLKLVPGLLAVMLVLASFGPWGAIGFTDRMQAANVIAALSEAGVLGADGRAKAWPDLSKLPLDFQQRAMAGIDHLARRERLDRLAPVFEGLPQSPFADYSLNAYSRGERLRLKLALNLPMAEAVVQGYGFYVQAPVVVDRTGTTRLIGPFTLDKGGPERRVATLDGDVVAAFKGGIVSVTAVTSGASAEFNLGTAPELRAAMEIQAKPGADISAMAPLVLKRSNGALEAELVLVQTYGVKYSSRTIGVDQAGFWLLMGKAEAP